MPGPFGRCRRWPAASSPLGGRGCSLGAGPGLVALDAHGRCRAEQARQHGGDEEPGEAERGERGGHGPDSGAAGSERRENGAQPAAAAEARGLGLVDAEVARRGGEFREGAGRGGDRDQVCAELGARPAGVEEGLRAGALRINEVAGREAGDKGEVVILVLHLGRRTVCGARWFPRWGDLVPGAPATTPAEGDEQEQHSRDQQDH
jgi:hypothetical protein